MAFGLAVYASQGRSPDTTQDSLPVAGQALLDGVLTRKVPMKGFRFANYISFPFPKLTWRTRRELESYRTERDRCHLSALAVRHFVGELSNLSRFGPFLSA